MAKREQAAAERAWKNAKYEEIAAANPDYSSGQVQDAVNKAWQNEKNKKKDDAAAAKKREGDKKKLLLDLAQVRMDFAAGRLTKEQFETTLESYRNQYPDLYTEIQQQRKVDEEEFKAQKEVEKIKEKEKIKRFTTNLQSFLYREMPKLQDFYKQKLDKGTIDENIHKIDETIQAGTYNQLMTGRGSDGKGLGEFVRATPAQLAMLQPLLRFFIVDQDGQDREIYFSDYTSEEYEKTIANIRSGADFLDALTPRDQRGSSAGIKYFSWNYNNKHEGDYIIEADLKLFFGTLTELVNANYLQFLFPTGAATELAQELEDDSSKVRSAETKKKQREVVKTTTAQKLRALQAGIDKATQLLGKPEEDIQKALQAQSKKAKANRDRSFRQLKVVVGWSLPKGKRNELLKLFGTREKLISFENGLTATNRAIFLNLVDYNVNFQQEGPTTLDLKYVGSSDNYMTTAGSDIFGSNNLEDSENKFLYKPTYVSLAGIQNNQGNVTDKRRANSQDSGTAQNYQLPSIAAINDPYISSKLSQETKNFFDEPSIPITLAGLKAAQDLISLKLRREQLMNKNENSPEIERLKQSSQVITLLYDRAVETRLRDIYSQFLDGLLSTNYVHKVKIFPPSETEAQPTIQPIKTSDEEAALLAEWERSISGAAGPAAPSPLDDPQGTTTVYFMRLGDILRRAMAVSDLRKDVSFIFGNVERFGNRHSVYDIPITIDTFGQFFYNTVVSRRRRFYPFRYFLNDLLRMVATMINQDTTIQQKVAFDYSIVSGLNRKSSAPASLQKLAPDNDLYQFVLDTADLREIRRSQENPLQVSGQYQHYYPIFETKVSLGDRTGDRALDESEGIYHYVIGSDRGLAKEFNFSRQEVKYFQEMLIESNQLDDKIQALFLPQNVSIRMYGNTLHKNGDLIFVDSRPSLGSFAGPVLGIGGYYRVIRSTHEISNRGYETNLECVFELRVSPDKTTRKRVTRGN
jgi:hypothetical protein